VISKLAGIHVQWPISTLIIDGKKTIETRTYPLPAKYIGVPLALVETPGKQGRFKARLIGVIQFDNSFQYNSRRDFYKDSQRHCVTPESPWRWVDNKPKFGWPVRVLERFKSPKAAPKKRGIIFCNNCEV